MIKQKIVVKPNPVQEKMLKFAPAGDEVAAARQAMMAAKEETTTTRGGTRVPSFIANQGKTARQAQPVAQPVQPDLSDFIEDGSPAVAAQTPTARVAQAPQAQHFDFGDYSVDIFYDAATRLWVLDIVQASEEQGQGGTERFTAKSKDDLLPILAKAKGNATSLIRKQTKIIKVQRIASLDGWDAFYATRNLTQAQVDKMDAVSREVLVDGIQVVHIQQFMNEHPGYINPQTWAPIEAFLNKHNAPYSKRNIDYACQELGIKLDGAPSAAPVAARVAAPAPVAPPVTPPPAQTPPEARKRATYSSGIRPGQSSGAGSGAFESDEGQPAETEIQRARRLSQTKEGLDQLRREAIPRLSQAKGR